MGSRTLLRLLAIAFLLAPAAAAAQGTIRGRVTDASNAAPLAGVQIRIDGTTLGTQTGSDGAYTVTGVPAGAQTISARRVGYAPESAAISVATAGDVTQNFALRPAAITLSEVVVTGVAAPTTKRQLGNTIETVSGEQVGRAPGVTSIDQALQGKVTGAIISENSGQPGGGISIRLRGTNSINGGAEPLYVIDGVLVDNSSEALINLSGNANRGNQALSNRMADFDPADVERIEVLKGAAAAALYGARANNGVIQIFTKRGQSGRPNVTVSTDVSWSNAPKRYELNMHPNAGVQDVAFGSNQPNGARPVLGQPVLRYDIQDQIFQTGMGTNTRVSVTGGNEGTTYYIGGGHQKEEGIVRPTSYKRTNVRANITQRVSSKLEVGVRGTYINSLADFIPEGEQTQGTLTSVVFTPTSFNYAFDPALGRYPYNPLVNSNALDVIENWSAPEKVTRMLGGVDATWRPMAPLTVKYMIGMDDYRREAYYYQPPFSTSATFLGSIQNPILFSRLFNNDLTVSHAWTRSENLALNTSAGFRYTQDKSETVRTASQPGPGQTLVGGPSQTATQSQTELRTVGWYLEERVSLQDRLFLTAGLNWDASSAFGADERVQMFPRLGLSYVVDQESWYQRTLGNFLSSLRLRAAYGQTGGQPPGLYSRFANYVNTPYAGKAGLVASVGAANPGLRPERQREYEGGFDAGFFNDRANLEFSYYDKKTHDLVLSVPLHPSSGFFSQSQNIGSLTNKGVEVAINTINMSRPNFAWRTRFTYSANRNKITKLVAATDSLLVDYLNAVIIGQPIGVFFGGTYARDSEGRIAYKNFNNPDTPNIANDSLMLPYRETVILPDGSTANARRIIGDPNPDFVATLGNEFDIGSRVKLSVLFDGRFGGDVANFSRRILELFGASKVVEREINGDTIPRTFAGNISGRSLIYEEYIEDGSFVKLREIALQFALGPSMVRRLGAQGATLRLSGRNLMTWTDYSGLDPEVNVFSASTVSRGVDFGTSPLPRQFSIGVTLNY